MAVSRRPVAVLTVIVIYAVLGALTYQGAVAKWSPRMNAWSGDPIPARLLKGKSPRLLQGAVVFQNKNCRNCHALEGVGHQVGPDLAALAHRSVEDLLSNILDPNMAISPGYVSYTAETIAGEIETGILQSESADTVVLLQALEKKVVLPRRTIKRLESSGLSLMPEGLEIGMTPADLRDLIAFLQEKR